MTGKEDLLQALVEAYIMEKGSREFYRQAAAHSGAAARMGFESLAEWENRHMLYLQSLYQSILDDRELTEFSHFSSTVPAPVAEGGMPVKELEKRIETFSVKNETDALSLAAMIEAKAFALYKDLAGKARSTESRVIFEDMMDQETRHMSEIAAMKKRLSPS